MDTGNFAATGFGSGPTSSPSFGRPLQRPIEPTNMPTPKPDWSEEELMEQVATKRCAKAFALLSMRITPRMRAWLIKSGIPQAAAQDILQNVLIKMWRKSDSFDPERASFRTWSYAVLRNARIDWLRRKRAETEELDDAQRHDGDLENEAISRMDSARIMSIAQAVLPEEQLHVITQSCLHDHSYARIAKEARVPLGTVKSRMRLALQTLRAALEGPTR